MTSWIYIKKSLSQTSVFAFASLSLCALSGLFLAIPYDVSLPYESVTRMFWESKEALFTRSFHYWSAQLFLIFTILHFLDYYLKTGFKEIPKGIWIRLVILIPVIFYLMLSGFLLKGDIESNAARDIFEGLLLSIPFFGESISFLLLGPENNFQLIYIHHVGTGLIITWLFTAEHGKYLYPNFWGIIKVFPFLIAISFFLIPSVHDPNVLIVKSPWYFIGTQELLHWISIPFIVIIIIITAFLAVYFWNNESSLLRKFSDYYLKTILVIYFILSIVGYFFRFDNWSFGLPWENSEKIEFPYLVGPDNYSFKYLDSKAEIKFVSGKPELCLSCHSNVKGFAEPHSPELIGCSSCHLGNSYSPNKSTAHKNMILIPGNMDNASITCGRSDCHPDIITRVEKSLMNTMSGIVSVDKYVFGEIDSPDKHYNIRDIGFSPADKHLRNLCASCHLGQIKDELGPITELSRGGGCLACHLNYSENSHRMLKVKNQVHNYHPSINLKVGNEHCFGCHSRSGRISTNYEGWYETLIEDNKPAGDKKFRVLDDGRVFRKYKADIHFDLGLECIDCHSSFGVMGDGKKYFHEEEAIKIKCIDCHNTTFITKPYDSLDIESQKIIGARGLYKTNRKYVIAESGYPIVNVYIDTDSVPKLRLKNSEKTFKLKPFINGCGRDIEEHSSLSCSSCHTDKVYRCISCHTQFESDIPAWDHLQKKDVLGSWHEKASAINLGTATLAVRSNANGINEVINTAPGMIMTIKLNKSEANKFVRYYAPVEPHSTTKESKSCIDCHLNTTAIGYGEGKLNYNWEQGLGYFTFIPQYNISLYDDLPEDAWISFLKDSISYKATRSNIRPFNFKEQQKILTVGSCFNCHKQDENRLIKIFKNYSKLKNQISEKCILPKYNIN